MCKSKQWNEIEKNKQQQQPYYLHLTDEETDSAELTGWRPRLGRSRLKTKAKILQISVQGSSGILGKWVFLGMAPVSRVFKNLSFKLSSSEG